MSISTLPAPPEEETTAPDLQHLDMPEEAVMADRPSLTILRLKAALSMNELARQARVSPNTVMDIERGSRPRMSTMRKLAAALDVKPQDIAWPGDPFSQLDPEESAEEEPQA
jgi:DNA-binding XRE family transcriptional regulator